MALETARKAFGFAAFAFVAASCGEPRGSPLERQGVASYALGSLVWGGEQKLAARDAAELDQFGYSVALSADRAIVGAYGETSYRGAAYVFAKSGNTWTEEQKLVARDGAEGDNFGWSVALGGDRVVVGAYGENGYRGAAYVFAKSGNTWTEEQKLVARDGAELDQLGYSLSLAGDRALVGAPGNDSYRGAAYVFVKSGNVWTEKQKLIARDGVPDDHLGDSVSLGASSALVGAPGNDLSRGAAYVFANRNSAWTEAQKLIARDGVERDHFGNSISLAGDRALVAAYWDDDLRGAAYVFVDSDGTWSEAQKLVARDRAGGDRFANSVSLSDDRALIGAVGYDSNRGAAYVFARDGSAWTQEQKLSASDGVSPDLFAWSVSLAGDHALIGANYTDELRGSAYAFSLGLPNGEPCSAAAVCASGHCADERCCNMDCTGPCGACSIAEGAAADGTCTVFPAGSEGSPACDPFACDGQSAECTRCQSDADCPEPRHCAADQTCSEPESCTRGDECTSGHCEDAICCDRSCAASERCRADLKVSGGDGVCGPAKAAALGEPCKFGVQCTSGHCTEGVCRGATRGAVGENAGCGCRVGTSLGRAPGPGLGVALALLLLRRRRPSAVDLTGIRSR